jgi:prepilin-type N-terminal cleavage/methylation domain-containing protein
MRKNISSRKGFSLVEVVIAIGIVAMLLTTFMAVFGPAQKNINKALGSADANRLVHTLENEMAILRPGEEAAYNSSSFEKAFQWIKDSPTKGNGIIVYQYQALPGTQNADGTLKAADIGIINDDQKFPGVDYITQTVARRVDKADATILAEELSPGVVQGKVYVVRMTQLIKDSATGSGLILGTPNQIVTADGTVVADSTLYEDGYITLQVEFFPLNNNLLAYVTGGSWEFGTLGSPVATQNIAVRR